VSRLSVLISCAAIAQIDYEMARNVSRGLHYGVMGVLGTWAVLSLVCQWAIQKERLAPVVRFLWAGADAVLLTALLYIDTAFNGPLIAVYPLLIAASGLWFRVELVVYTTGLSILGYGLLVVDQTWRHVPLHEPNWHVVFLLTLACTGGIVVYLVHRVGALSRFYGRKP
jgi:serine/threonine-protein kinase